MNALVIKTKSPLHAVWNKMDKDDTTEKKDAIGKFRLNFQMSKKQLLPVKTS